MAKSKATEVDPTFLEKTLITLRRSTASHFWIKGVNLTPSQIFVIKANADQKVYTWTFSVLDLIDSPDGLTSAAYLVAKKPQTVNLTKVKSKRLVVSATAVLLDVSITVSNAGDQPADTLPNVGIILD